MKLFAIRIPPLRERREDIPLLVRHYIQKSARQLQKPIETIPAAAMKILTNRTTLLSRMRKFGIQAKQFF